MNRSKTKVDYLIVGQGIAGISLAYRLIKKGRKVFVIDQYSTTSSSRVAAGIINPITGRNLVKSWLIDTLIEEARLFYQEMEELFDVQLYHPIPIYKIFSSVKEQNQWNERTMELGYSDYLSKIKFPNWQGIECPFGVGTILNGSWVDVSLLIDKFSNWLKDQNSLLEERFDFDAFDFESEITYKGIKADKIIFCEGASCKNNPFFNYLPFALVKGELMTIRTNALEGLDGLLNKNGFVLPLGENKFGVGATFSWNDVKEEITLRGLEELKQKLEKLTSADYEILEQKVGIRPAVKDRRPFLGQHPKHNELYIFNGLGTKGISLAPYCSKLLMDYLENGEPLLPDLDILRYQFLLV